MKDPDKRSFLERLQESNKLPSLPHILLRIIEACNREDYDFKEVSRIIETDPALTTRILQMVNSPLFNLPNKVLNLDQALVLMGMDIVKNIALCTSIHQVFSAKEEETDRHSKKNSGKIARKKTHAFKLIDFWKHSLLCALLVRAMAKRISYSNPDEAFLAGLLHDIGKLVLWVNMPEEYEAIMAASTGNPDRLLPAEVKLGATHNEVGAWLIREWDLQSSLADSILYHHEPTYRIIDSSALVKLVYVANALSYSEDENSKKIAETVFGFEAAGLEKLITQAKKDMASIAHRLGIKIDLNEAELHAEPDADKQMLLTREIKNTSLLLGTLNSMVGAKNEQCLIKILHQGFRILFGIERAVFCRYDFERDLIVISDLGNILIPFYESKSILVQSLNLASILNSFEKNVNLSIIDRQIIRLTKKEGIICLPLIANGAKLGVVAVCVNRSELSRIMNRIKRISLLTDQVALAMYTDSVRRRQTVAVRNERISATSEVTHRIIHEANNPLGIIKNYLVIMKKKLASESTVENEMRIVSEEIDRISRLLDELSEFSDQKKPELGPINVNSVISDVLAISKETLLSEISVKLNLEDNLPRLRAGEDSLKQIILNLIKNAAEAMSGGGDLKISTRFSTTFPQDEISELDVQKGHGYIRIDISDSGPGIPETLRIKLFEPFVSSKGRDHKGIGLSVVYGLVKSLKGTICLRSSREEGTTFTILFPSSPKST